MMRAKADPKATTNLILFVACVLLAGGLMGLIWKKPRASLPERQERVKEAALLKEIKKAHEETALANATVAAFTWTGENSAIQNMALSTVSELAKKNKVTLVRFQPQRNPSTSDVLEQIQFLIVVEGPFPGVAAMERDLEVPNNRLAVDLFQIGSSDSQTNAVTANIGVVAHRVPPAAPEKETKNGKKRA